MQYTLERYKEAEKYVIDKIKELKYPFGHPFLEYPNTPNSRSLIFLILLKVLMQNEQKIIVNLLKKCRAVEDRKFSNTKYIEGLDEVLILYYVLVDNWSRFETILYEPSGLMDNDKTLEYSLVYKEENCVVNIEAKTMLCDPFIKEESLPVKDGTVLIKKLVNDVNDDEYISKLKDGVVELKKSVYYTALKRNIKKIIEKFEGKKAVECRMLNLGFICIHFSTSMEEFYTYLFHKEKGIYQNMDWGNLDALVLFVCDAKNDIKLENIYRMGYVKTILINEDIQVQKKLSELRLDNYISIGKMVSVDIFELAQRSYSLFKIMNREGFLNIIPYDTSEEDIEKYVEYLKGSNIRYDDTV